MRIVAGDYVANKVFCHKRNIVERVTMQGKEFVVKCYKRPNFFNRVVYTCFRGSKARRAYEHALRLLECGIDTPFPVAYVEIKKGGLFSTGYFISEYMPYNLMSDAYAGLVTEGEVHRLTKEFMDFTLKMHAMKVLPLDFNSSNIFYHVDEESGAYRFALTDINRMRFGKLPSTSDAMRSFEQFGVPTERLYKLAVYYCSRKNSDIEYSIFIFLFHRIRGRVQRRLKRKVKSRLQLL